MCHPCGITPALIHRRAGAGDTLAEAAVKLRGVPEDQHILDGNPLSARSLRQVLALLERELRWTTARPVP
jgi:hypothetical protein